MPAPVLIANRPLLPRLLLLFWVAEIAVGLLFAWAGADLIGASENGGAIVLLLMGLLLSAAGVVMAGLCWRIAGISGHAIEMTDDGLLDRRLSRQRIPWDAIAWKLLFNGRSYSVQAAVAEPQRSSAGIYLTARALGVLPRLFRQPEFTIFALGTGLSAHEIASRLETFRSPQP